MTTRTKLADRQLPNYSIGEETMNMVTHIVGGGVGILTLALCVLRAIDQHNVLGIIGSAIFGFTMIALYTISSIYHGLQQSIGKKVMQVIDHCAIYFLIAGTYTPILLSAFVPRYPMIGWGLLAAEWILVALAATLTAIDLKKYNIFSMVCYIAMGWGIILFTQQAIELLTPHGFYWLLAGGIVYTIGAILYGIGSKVQWMHSIFHIFVVLGSILQAIAILFYAL